MSTGGVSLGGGSSPKADSRACARDPLLCDLALLVAALPEDLRPYGAEVARAVLESDEVLVEEAIADDAERLWRNQNPTPCRYARDVLYAWLFPPHPVGQRPTDEQRTRAERAGLALLGAAGARRDELVWPSEAPRGRVEREVARGIAALEAA